MKTIGKMMLGAAACAIATTAASAQEGKEMLSNGIKYLNLPYVEGTLEQNGDQEELVINCDEVDCVTFVEYVLAESITPKQADGDVLESEFADNVMKIRYRDGKIDGYTSRLHYISEWINNGVKGGFLRDVTGEMSADKLKLSLSYMTTHPQQYTQLANSLENIARMRQIEQSLSGREVRYLPADKLTEKGLPWIKDGDIIAITTDTEGLDIAHMGIAFYVDKKLTLLHASATEKKVLVSTVPLSEMLRKNNRWTGIRVLRIQK